MFALIGVLGIGAQWAAWWLRMPAIVLMLVAGLLAGPVSGVLDPSETLGDLFRPVVAVAVAVILFEGGLTLNFRDLREAGPMVRRLIFPAAPLAWILAGLAAHYGAGLSIATSAVLGGILIVTGPTVITPLLRQARLASRPANALRWEAIVNDPVGALAAVLAFEAIAAINGHGTLAAAMWHLAYGVVFAGISGVLAGRLTVFAFLRGYAPEYMKVPVLFGLVLLVYAVTDLVLHESGLLAVTAMGLVLANAHLPSLTELRRFKEHATIILVSGVFIILAASLEREMLMALDLRALIFVALILFVVRPLAVLISLIGTGIPLNEKLIVAWIGPRGVVAVAVSGLFASRLADLGVPDAAMLGPLAFAIVAATVLLHGFTISPLARMLGLTSSRPPGVLIAGASNWSVALASELEAGGLPVLVIDRNFANLRAARQAGLSVFHGEILSEAAEHSVAMSAYGHLLTATYDDAYNTLICTDFGPEFGRSNVYQVGRHEAGEGDRDMPNTLGGRSFGASLSYSEFDRKLGDGWRFVRTGLSDEYDFDAYLSDRKDAAIIGVIRRNGHLEMATGKDVPTAQSGDTILALVHRTTG